MGQAIWLSVTIVSSAALVVLGALAIFAGLVRNTRRAGAGGPTPQTRFLFRGETLVECSEPARALAASFMAGNAPLWDELRAYLAEHFPDAPAQFDRLHQTRGFECLSCHDAGLRLTVRVQSGLTQVQISHAGSEGALVAIDRLSLQALKAELATLRDVSRLSPALVWRTDEAGQVCWANAPYLALARAMGQTTLGWPLPDVFAGQSHDAAGRVRIESAEGTQWFAPSQYPAASGVLHFAVPIDDAVQSEIARRDTLQTLTRTFASLPIGLALFDAERRLQVFNPALVDLTGLEPLFLAARPSFEHFLFTLREKRMLPEPKDFHEWRDEIVAMESAAASGEYTEEWTLGDGRSFLVTGRPQPNGAIALFIEDVTADAVLARSYRAEIALTQDTLAALDEGLVVFGLGGQALLANAAYARLWGTDPCADLADGGLVKALGLWAERCRPTTLWARLAEFVADPDGPRRLEETVDLTTGNSMAVQAQRLPGGAVLVRFALGALAPRALRPDAIIHRDILRQPDLAQPVPLESTMPSISLAHAARKPRSARHSGSRARIVS